MSVVRHPHPSATSILAVLAILGMAPAAVLAHPMDGRDDVRVHLPPAPARTADAARRSIAMLDKAALVACGGSDNSFAQVKAAVRQSACWHQAMEGAIAQADDHDLSAWWAMHRS